MVDQGAGPPWRAGCWSVLGLPALARHSTIGGLSPPRRVYQSNSELARLDAKKTAKTQRNGDPPMTPGDDGFADALLAIGPSAASRHGHDMA